MIIGIDEVGRGAWAGPLVVAAVALGGEQIGGLTDSKLLTKTKRKLLTLQIKQRAPLIGIGWVSARDIDHIGLSEALKLAARRAVSQIDMSQVDQIIIDGTIALIDDPRVTLMKRADLLVPSVSAASIIAKVARDQYMAQCDTVFAGYGWASHVGYGVAAHRSALRQLGPTPLHRLSFEPLASQYGKNSHVQNNAVFPVREGVTTRVTGNLAEDAAANYLVRQGYDIIDRNWKTKWCEVDIIARRREVMYFVEVKYRRSTHQGGGIAAITPKKLRQMGFAAKLWLHTNGEYDARLSVVEVTGGRYEVSAFVESVE